MQTVQATIANATLASLFGRAVDELWEGRWADAAPKLLRLELALPPGHPALPHVLMMSAYASVYRRQFDRADRARRRIFEVAPDKDFSLALRTIRRAERRLRRR